jgi:S1-C subfamily serine protease
MSLHVSLLPRVVLVGVVSLALAATLGFAQPKAEKAPEAAPGYSADSPTQGQEAPSEPGVLVVGVQPGSPAAKAGLSRGDIILEAAGTAVNTPRDLRQVIDSRKSGDTISLKVRHGDAQKSMSLALGARSGAAWLGVQLYPGGPGRGERFGRIPPFPEGALVENVVAGSPAEKAGVNQGDVILSVDGTRIDFENSLADLVSGRKVGDTVTLSLASPAQGQPGAARDVKVTLEKSPDKDVPYLGVQYTMAPPRFGRDMPGPAMMAGVLVAEVTPDSPAAKAGIKARDLITRVEGVAVSSPQQVVDAVSKHKPGDTLLVSVSRTADGKDTDITVTLAQNPGDASKAWMGLSLSSVFGRGEDGPGGMMRQPRMVPRGAPGRDGAPPTL